LRWRSGTSIRCEGRSNGGRGFQYLDPLFEGLDGRLQLLDASFEVGETIAHDVTPLRTGGKFSCSAESRSRPTRESCAAGRSQQRAAQQFMRVCA
jgi:hypothetical protein